jgi:hypothetical protein
MGKNKLEETWAEDAWRQSRKRGQYPSTLVPTRSIGEKVAEGRYEPGSLEDNRRMPFSFSLRGKRVR